MTDWGCGSIGRADFYGQKWELGRLECSMDTFDWDDSRLVSAKVCQDPSRFATIGIAPRLFRVELDMRER